MNLHIPPLGEKLVLVSDWTFDLYQEYRNTAAAKHFKAVYATDERGYYNHKAPPFKVTLAVGTELTIRRYYIRLGQKDFDSVTFSAKIGKKSIRFWVKLADANKIEFA